MKIPALIFLLASTFLTPAVAEEIPAITIAEMESIIDSKKAIILDANGSKYFAKGHIPGAVDFRAHEENLAKVLGEDKKQLVVVYCGSPSCEAYLNAAVAVQQLGYTNVKHLPAGISGWITAGKPTDVTKE
ncbi:rhodanese-like domain-containing protein [Verrucomicrobiales bacterium]|nr:rhodanese-like domain-containing protein [Verrucomicrobiales bacterium]|tara:strand:+ start:736 stop:1128 length:393 start_codon:yes stop_codon:yes gene_type:complete